LDSASVASFWIRMFGSIYAAAGSSFTTLLEVAREFSPRIEACSDREIVLDLDGLATLFGDARTIAEELRRTAADRGLRVRVAIAGTRTTARLMAHYRAGITVVPPGDEARALAPLPLGLVADVATANGPDGTNASNGANDPNDPVLLTLRRWGLRTLGNLADLPDEDLAARLGQPGVAWQRLARGEDPRPLVPAVPEERFEQALDLEWPIDGLEPLSFVLGRLLDPLSAHLERRDRGAAVLHVRLHLVRGPDGMREVHARTLQLPAPMRDARTLRTLALLDLESHPPSAAIDRVEVAVDPTPGRVLQFSLLTRPLPSPEQLSTLLARLTALMGDGRCGSPMPVDSWQPGAFTMKTFAPRDADQLPTPNSATPKAPWELGCWELGVVRGSLRVVLRRFRFPVPARVRTDEGKPSRVRSDRRGLGGGDVETCAGPWRTSGTWWESSHWDRDEWDVALADGVAYRLVRERTTDAWFIDGVLD
jgi:protein ImuB